MAGKNKDLISKSVHSLIQSMKTVFLMQGAVCKYEPSCSRYAQEAVRTLPLPTAVIKIIWRVLRCNPLSRGGYDPVSLQDNQVKGAQ
ncbi:MAG: membrane protein insertion efficiency factor YidD [Chitinispirillaceae bacterium]